MGLEGITLSEISQREEDKYCMISLTCRIQKEKKTKTKTQQTHRYREQIDGCQRLGAGGDAWTDEGGQKVQTFSYKINKSWEYNALYGDYSF